MDKKLEISEESTAMTNKVKDEVETIIPYNQETLDAMEEARRLLKEPNGWFTNLDDFWKDVWSYEDRKSI